MGCFYRLKRKIQFIENNTFLLGVMYITKNHLLSLYNQEKTKVGVKLGISI